MNKSNSAFCLPTGWPESTKDKINESLKDCNSYIKYKNQELIFFSTLDKAHLPCIYISWEKFSFYKENTTFADLPKEPEAGFFVCHHLMVNYDDAHGVSRNDEYKKLILLAQQLIDNLPQLINQDINSETLNKGPSRQTRVNLGGRLIEGFVDKRKLTLLRSLLGTLNYYAYIQLGESFGDMKNREINNPWSIPSKETYYDSSIKTIDYEKIKGDMEKSAFDLMIYLTAEDSFMDAALESRRVYSAWSRFKHYQNDENGIKFKIARLEGIGLKNMRYFVAILEKHDLCLNLTSMQLITDRELLIRFIQVFRMLTEDNSHKNSNNIMNSVITCKTQLADLQAFLERVLEITETALENNQNILIKGGYDDNNLFWSN